MRNRITLMTCLGAGLSLAAPAAEQPVRSRPEATPRNGIDSHLSRASAKNVSAADSKVTAVAHTIVSPVSTDETQDELLEQEELESN